MTKVTNDPNRSHIEAAITQLSDVSHQIDLYYILFEDDGAPRFAAETVHRQLGRILGALDRTSEELLNTCGPLWTSASRVADDVHDLFDIVTVTRAGVAGGQYPSGGGVTNSPVYGAIKVVARDAPKLIAKLRAIQGKLPTTAPASRSRNAQVGAEAQS